MREITIQVPIASGSMETFVVRPDSNGRWPLIIVYMDVWGIREELFTIARRIAQAGYCAVVPDLYYRQGKVRNEFRDREGRMITLARLDPIQQEQVRAPLRKLSDEMVMEDTAALLAYADRNLPIRRLVGAVGYCMGGRFALLALGRFADRFRAAASLHGTALVGQSEQSPHKIAAAGIGEVYCGFAERDPHGSAEVVAAMDRSFAASKVAYSYLLHRGAEHGYALPDRDIHDAGATERDWTAILAMFARQLTSDRQRV